MGQKKVLMNLCRAPFGNIFYTEGLRATVGVSAGVDENIPTVLYQGDGVYYCLKGADREDALAYFESMKNMETKIYAVKEDLDDRGIAEAEVAPDISVIPREKAFQLYKENDLNLDF